MSTERDVLAQHGEVKPGLGLLSGAIALGLSVLSVLAVLAFRFPQWLSTPELRAHYDVTTLRYMLFAAMVIAGGLAIRNLLLGRNRKLAAAAFGWVAFAQVLGGPATPIGDVPESSPYIGLDFFILDLLGSSLIFIFIEKFRPLRKEQPVFRPEWQTDLIHFFVNHLVVGLTLLLTNRVVSAMGWFASDRVHEAIKAMPFLLSLFLVFLCADLVQYWAHRAYHEVPWLWRFHAVHHSAKAMDWLAGSRQSLFELIGTRIAVITPIFVLGFPREVVDVYIIVVGFQAVFDHANVSAGLGPLKYIFVTPNFHHWHHSRDTEAIDKNYAAHFAFLDYLFGTAAKADRPWPDRYGVVGDYIPEGFVAQQLFPFIGSTEDQEQQQSGDRHTAAGKRAAPSES
jgi:sterol desaturase/sphingolipid hydroxylase (fatty acid hydroxylase superfamily)